MIDIVENVPFNLWKRRHAAVSGAIFSMITLGCLACAGEDWPNWRGPSHNGISTETGWKAHWPAEGPKRLWKALVGIGFSSIAVSGGRAYTMGNRNDVDTVFCFDAESGRLMWKQSYPCPADPNYYEGGTSATPTVDGSRVFTLSKKGDLFCFDSGDGKIIWSKNPAKEIGAAEPGWGFASSPFVAGDMLLLNAGTAGTAVDKTTGKVLWTSGADAGGYSTPVPAVFDGAPSVAMMIKDAAVGVEIKSGRELWRYPWKSDYDLNIADTLVAGQKVFVSSPYKRGCALLEIKGGSVDVLWETKAMGNQLNSSVLVDGFVYGMDGMAGPKPNATMKCLDFQTGAVKWISKAVGAGTFMVAAGKFIALSDKGELMTAAVSPEGFKIISSAQVLGGKCWTVPVLANGRIYCRNALGVLVCLDVRAE